MLSTSARERTAPKQVRACAELLRFDFTAEHRAAPIRMGKNTEPARRNVAPGLTEPGKAKSGLHPAIFSQRRKYPASRMFSVFDLYTGEWPKTRGIDIVLQDKRKRRIQLHALFAPPAGFASNGLVSLFLKKWMPSGCTHSLSVDSRSRMPKLIRCKGGSPEHSHPRFRCNTPIFSEKRQLFL